MQVALTQEHKRICCTGYLIFCGKMGDVLPIIRNIRKLSTCLYIRSCLASVTYRSWASPLGLGNAGALERLGLPLPNLPAPRSQHLDDLWRHSGREWDSYEDEALVDGIS